MNQKCDRCRLVGECLDYRKGLIFICLSESYGSLYVSVYCIWLGWLACFSGHKLKMIMEYNK